MPVTFKSSLYHPSNTTVAVPTHAVGDIIILFANSYAFSIPQPPASGGTVPTWTPHPNNVGFYLGIWYAVATATNHTTGAWTGTQEMGVVVLSGQGSIKPLGDMSLVISYDSPITAPALNLRDISGKSQLLHFFTMEGTSTLAAAPAGYTARATTSGSQSSNFRLLTKDSTTSDGAVTQGLSAGAMTGFRALSIEVKEDLPQPTPKLLTTFSTVGSFTYTIPDWASRIDVICLGGGGGGQGGGALNSSGKGGGAATWAAASITRNVEIPWSAKTLSVTVGAGGTKGLGPLKDVGGNGGNSSVIYSGTTIALSAGGVAGSSGATGADTTGLGPVPTTLEHGQEQEYVGGVDRSSGLPGSEPGGGGCGGPGGVGGGSDGFDGGKGTVWIFAYDDRPAFFPMM